MDMRQAAEFFKTRWKWRKEPDWYREEQAKRNERQKAAVAAKRAAKTPTDGTGSSQSSTPEKGGQQGSQQPSNDPQSGKQAPQKTPINKQQQAVKDPQSEKQRSPQEVSKKAKRGEEQQKIIADYLQSTLTVLEETVKAEPSKEKIVKSSIAEALELLRKDEVTPEDLLKFGRGVEDLSTSIPGIKQNVENLKNNKWSTRQRSYWELVQKELKHLNEQEIKGQKLEFSSNLAKDSLSVFDAFLGPAGPLFKTARELYTEYKDSAKSLIAKFDKIGTWIGTKLSKLKKIWSGKDSLFKRLFPKFAAALDKFGSKLKDMGGGLLDKLGLSKHKGKLGKAFGVAKAIGSFLPTDIGKTVGMLGIAGAGSAVHAVSTGVHKVSTSVSDLIDEAKTAAKKMGGSIVELFSGFTKWVTSSWQGITSTVGTTADLISTGIDKAKLNFLILKDDVEEQRDKIWDSITGWFDKIWEKIKSFIPNSVRNAASKVAETTGQAVDWTKKKAGQAATMAKDALGIKSDPDGGDGVSKPKSIQVAQVGDAESGKKAVKVQSGVNLSGMNAALMNNFYAMAGEYNRLTGKTVQVNSAYRSKEEQAQLKAMYPGKAATPGYSMHEYGLAIDINSADANAMENMGLFSKFGFVRPVSGEAWHVEPLAIQGMKSAIRKGNASVDSAVAESGQGGQGSGTAQAKAETEGNVTQAVQTATQQTKTDVTAAASTAVMPPTVQNAQAPKDSETKTPTLAQSFAKPSAAGMPSTVDGATTSMAGIPQAQSNVSTIGSMDANVSMPMPPVPTGPTTMTTSVAPKLDAQYERVESRSKRLDKTVVQETTDDQIARSNNHQQVGANNVPFYLGDMGMLTLNLGIGA